MKTLKQHSYNEWLVVRSQNGETDAFELLIRSWQPRLYSYAFNRLRDKEAARDVLQECLLGISKNLSQLTDPAAFPKWSFRIVECRCVDWMRKTVRERQIFADAETPMEAAVTHVDNHADTHNEQRDFEIQQSVRSLLKIIDPKLAQVLRLYYLESFSINDIAEIIDVPRGTVKSRLYYARKMMAQALEG